MRDYQGVVNGIVTDRDDPEQLGRVILKFPWLDEEYRTDWVPIATPMTGDKRGQFFMPEEGDEVLVSFFHGDLDHPFVIGFLWDSVQKPPETELSNRVILTPGGHTLRFEDGSQKKIILKSKAGNTITLEDTPEEPPGQPTSEKITIETPGGQKIVLDDKATTIEMTVGGSTVKVEASAITLTGGGRSLALSGGQVAIT